MICGQLAPNELHQINYPKTRRELRMLLRESMSGHYTLTIDTIELASLKLLGLNFSLSST